MPGQVTSSLRKDYSKQTFISNLTAKRWHLKKNELKLIK